MKYILAIVCIFAVVAIFSSTAAPTNSQNPQIDTIRRGLIQKLCDNAHGKLNQRTATALTSTVRPGNTDIQGNPVSNVPLRRTTAQTIVDAPPTCNEFNNLSFEQLIGKNKALLKPVSTARPIQ